MSVSVVLGMADGDGVRTHATAHQMLGGGDAAMGHSLPGRHGEMCLGIARVRRLCRNRQRPCRSKWACRCYSVRDSCSVFPRKYQKPHCRGHRTARTRGLTSTVCAPNLFVRSSPVYFIDRRTTGWQVGRTDEQEGCAIPRRRRRGQIRIGQCVLSTACDIIHTKRLHPRPIWIVGLRRRDDCLDGR